MQDSITVLKYENLKSSMDRFIDRKIQQSRSDVYNLKSSMDRFIDIRFVLVSFFVCNLKSSMDRFIACDRGCRGLASCI